MVVVERGAFLEAQIVPVAVVAIVIEHRHLVRAEALDDAPDHGGLAGAGPAGHAHDDARSAARAYDFFCLGGNLFTRSKTASRMRLLRSASGQSR